MVPRPEHLRAVELDVRLLAAPGRPGGAHGAEAVGQSGPRGEGREDPLVLATALTSQFEADTSSCVHETRPCPSIADDGAYIHRPDGRPIRVYRWVDTRLVFEDFYAKLAELAAWQRS